MQDITYTTITTMMHQPVFDCAAPTHPAGCGRRSRRRSAACGAGRRCSGCWGGLGLSVLSCDPMLELVYRSGLLSLRDLRVLVACTESEAIHGVAKERALERLAAAAASLRATRSAFELCAARVRGVALDVENRLLQLGVPMNAVHPELGSPLKEGDAPHHAVYAGLATLGQALRSASHPASWAQAPGSLWDAVAASASISMRPQLVLLLASLLPTEARMSYLALRHAAYSSPGVHDLGGLVKKVLLRMMLRGYGPLDARRLAKQLKQVAPSLSPFSFWLLRQCAAGDGAAALTLAQRQQRRVVDEAALSAAIDRLFAERQEQVLYSADAWVAWLQDLPTRHLLSLYIKYLFDSFQ